LNYRPSKLKKKQQQAKTPPPAIEEAGAMGSEIESRQTKAALDAWSCGIVPACVTVGTSPDSVVAFLKRSQHAFSIVITILCSKAIDENYSLL
jgi:dUTPase